MEDIHNTEATHYVVDFYNVEESSLLDNLDFCKALVEDACIIAKCGILNIFSYKFEPQGLSINATLSESHCTIHTWPEKQYCAIDLYGCGNSDLLAGIQHFSKALKPGKAVIRRIRRGHEHEIR